VWSALHRGIRKRGRSLGLGVLVFGYLLALFLISDRVSLMRGSGIEAWVDEVKARPSAPLDPLPQLRIAERDAADLARDPFAPLPAALPRTAVAPVNDAAEFTATRFTRSYIDIDRPVVLVRDARGDLYRLRIGDRVNRSVVVKIEPHHVTLVRNGREEIVEIRGDP
jgi:hypothetical protein